MPNRRSVLIGLGGLVAGGGAILGTGAFDTVEAQRTVSVETAGDAEALLGLTPADRGADGGNEYVDDPGDDTISINLDGTDDEDVTGLNQNARTTLRNLVTVTNQGTQTVNSVTLELTTSSEDITVGETFSFPVDETDDDGEGMASNGENILSVDDVPDSLGSGEPVNFGLEIDLIDGGDEGDLPDDEDTEYTLTITAESTEN